MAELKTKRNKRSVVEFLEQIEDEQKKRDAFLFLNLFKKVTQLEAALWGDAIIGFGTYHYVYASGREGDWMLTGFSPRKQKFSLYIMSGFSRFNDLLQKLGKHKTAKSCLYVNKWEDIDPLVLEELIKQSVSYMKEKYNGED